MEELRRRVDDDRARFVALASGGFASAAAGVPLAAGGWAPLGAGLEPPGLAASPNVVTVAPGMTMAQIERAAIEAALRETRGNRRKAAEILDIGERTLYRKLKEYQLPLGTGDPDN